MPHVTASLLLVVVRCCAALTVSVGGSACTGVVQLSERSLTCVLPAGVRSNVPVIVTSTGSASRAALLVSYALPTVVAISGCTPGVTNSSVIDCPRLGGALITLTGRHHAAVHS